MTTQGDEWHTMNPPIEEAEEIPYDPSKKGPGTMTIEARFDRPEIERLWAGLDRETDDHPIHQRGRPSRGRPPRGVSTPGSRLSGDWAGDAGPAKTV